MGDLKMEALRLKALFEEEVLQAVEQGNKTILRYLVNNIYRIRKSEEVDVLQKVSDGDSEAVESALRTMLLSKWEGPIVKFLDEDRQTRMIKCEEENIRIIANNLDWIDPNVQYLAMEGDNEGIRMASNQLHYKSLRNLKGEEYLDDFKMKSYDQALADEKFKGKTERVLDSDKGWILVENRKKRAKLVEKLKIHPSSTVTTIFIAKIPNRTRAFKIWKFFSSVGRVMDIILPKKRDRFSNRIGFIKTEDVNSAEKILKNLKNVPFLGSLLDYQYSGENKMTSTLSNQKNGIVYADLNHTKETGQELPLDDRKEGDVVKEVLKPVSQKKKEKVNSEAKWKVTKDHREGVKNKGKEVMYDEDNSSKKTYWNGNNSLKKEGVLNKKLENLEKDKNLFDKGRIKHWLHGIRNIEEEDLRIKRKGVVEVRGLPYISWTEDTLMDSTKNLGDWGWWINEVEENKKMENPKVCIYFAELFNIANKSSIIVKGVGYEVGIVEIPFDFHVNESNFHSYKDKSATSKVKMDKEKSNKDHKRTYSKEDDLSNVSRISDTFDINDRRYEETSPQRDTSISKAELV
ncbi:hypothetical protein POM88_036287 [Heracleum sosnowskyi]|uniref:RRM domain-containing protein n=1 Tax=Heracleum sosnowskyi TaxID=360622 RepID=A0AAD8HQ78_9APIA|nr:hypothetical protein POM88_036287 [Heracleum sosnowskyi]